MFTLLHFFLIWNMFRPLSVSYIFSFITCFSKENVEPLDYKHEEHDVVDLMLNMYQGKEAGQPVVLDPQDLLLDQFDEYKG
jgi:hypothetical protein